MLKKPDKRHQLGAKGEELARKYLEKLGYAILDTNYYKRLGELDIVALEADCVVFVEVKTRSSLAFGRPAEAVDSHKIKKISRAAKLFLLENSHLGPEARFDVIEVYLAYGQPPEINHLTNAFDCFDN